MKRIRNLGYGRKTIHRSVYGESPAKKQEIM